MRIQNNIVADNSQRQYGINTRNIGANTEKLSSGFRVNRAADDAAGLAISEKMRTQIRGLNRASLNIQEGISLLQVGDGALQSIHNKMQRMRELSVQAANGTNTLMDRDAIQLEFGQLTSEINSVVQMTNFNGRLLFDGSIGASWEYNLGKITTPFTTTIPAGNEFAPSGVDVPGWTIPTGFGGAAALTGLNASPPGVFPPSGMFAMQIVTPADGTLNVVIDFAIENSDGMMDINRFRNFFIDEFNRIGRENNIGHIVDNITYDGDSGRIQFVFPEEDGFFTGVMGRPPNIPTPPNAALPRVHIGVGGTTGQVDSLNGPNTATPEPFISNRPSGSPPLTIANFTDSNRDIMGSTIVLPPGTALRLGAPVPDGFYNITISVDSRPTAIHLIPGNYPDIESFIDANRKAFETALPRGFNLDISDDGKLVITSKGLDESPVVTFSTNPPALAAALGFSGSINITTEREPGGSLVIQSGANKDDIVDIEIPRLCTRSLGLSIRRPEDNGNPTNQGFDHINSLGANGYAAIANVAGDPPEYSLDVTTQESASAALSVLTNAINIISMERARMGAQQNRLEYAMSNANNTSENLQAAESRIRDVDMAAEMTTFVQNQILMQAGTAMMSHANSLPQGVLQLLG